MMNRTFAKINGEDVCAANASAIGDYCLVSTATAHRWLASGKLKPANGIGLGKQNYFRVADLNQLRAESLAGWKEKLKASPLTPEETLDVLRAGVADVQAKQRQLRAMLATMKR